MEGSKVRDLIDLFIKFSYWIFNSLAKPRCKLKRWNKVDWQEVIIDGQQRPALSTALSGQKF